jgi:broad specificity phosphatase PhoE
MLTRRRVALLALASIAFLVAASRRASDTVVILVRHAEKAGPSGDVSLSEADRARARALVAVAREAGVSAIITTQFARTRETAAPIAESLGVAPQVIPAGGNGADHIASIVAAIRTQFAGSTVLVVGHSNTVPAIVGALGGPKLRDLCEDEYDQLFIVVVTADGPTRFVRSRYGEPSMLGETCRQMQAK